LKKYVPDEGKVDSPSLFIWLNMLQSCSMIARLAVLKRALHQLQ
jgi:hypothetical protein